MILNIKTLLLLSILSFTLASQNIINGIKFTYNDGNNLPQKSNLSPEDSKRLDLKAKKGISLSKNLKEEKGLKFLDNSEKTLNQQKPANEIQFLKFKLFPHKYYNNLKTIKLQVGNSELDFIIDSGSSDICISSKNVNPFITYDEQTSAIQVSATPVVKRFASESFIANLYQDSFTLGNNAQIKLYYLLLLNTVKQSGSENNINGLIGVGRRSHSFVKQLKAANVIQKDILSFYTDEFNESFLYFGSKPNVATSKEYQFCELIKYNEETNYWTCSIREITFETINPVRIQSGYSFNFDTASSKNILREDLFNSFISLFNKLQNVANDCEVYTSNISKTFVCRKSIDLNIFPTIRIKFSDKSAFSFKPINYFKQSENPNFYEFQFIQMLNTPLNILGQPTFELIQSLVFNDEENKIEWMDKY